MNVKETIQLMESEGAAALMGKLYGGADVARQVKRYQDLLAGYEKTFGDNGEVRLFSSPGRTEISGNHTDHNHGKVLAGSINLDCVGVAAKNSSSKVRIVSASSAQDFNIYLNPL